MDDKIIRFPSKGTNDNSSPPPVTPAKVPHVFEVSYLDGTSETAEGFLSVGPVFVAIVDEHDFVNLVISSDCIKSIRKLCTVEEMYADLEAGPAEAFQTELDFEPTE